MSEVALEVEPVGKQIGEMLGFHDRELEATSSERSVAPQKHCLEADTHMHKLTDTLSSLCDQND